MKTLAIETSGKAGSVAALVGGRLLREIRLPADQRSAKSLAPAMAELFSATGWGPREVRLVAVAVGPGSFTGLRIGVTTAKVFAYLTRAEVVGVNTLEVIAAQAPADIGRLSVVLGAERQQLFASDFT